MNSILGFGLTRSIRPLCAGLCLTAALLTGCGTKVQGGVSGGNTSWLQACDSDNECKSGLCARGACAESCSNDTQCADLERASCAPVVANAQCESVTPRLCAPRCSGDAECRSIGDGYSCIAGACAADCRAGVQAPDASAATSASPSVSATMTTPNSGPTSDPSTNVEAPDGGSSPSSSTVVEVPDGGPSSSSSTSTEPPDSGPCPADEWQAYLEPGCDGTVAPVCVPLIGDACLTPVCGCDGRTLYGCGRYESAWQRVGSCDDAGGDASGS
jgi:hypothetical protein